MRGRDPFQPRALSQRLEQRLRRGLEHQENLLGAVARESVREPATSRQKAIRLRSRSCQASYGAMARRSGKAAEAARRQKQQAENRSCKEALN